MDRIVFDKTKFSQKGNLFEERTEEIDVPELNPLMGFPSLEEMRGIERKLADLKGKTESEKETKKLEKKLSEAKTVIFRVSQIGLSEYVKIKRELNDWSQNLIDGVMNAATKSGNAVEDEMVSVLKTLKNMNAQAKYQLMIIEAGLVEPKLNWSDLVWIAKMFPMVAMRLSDKIFELTNKGASLKKNLRDS
jgi:hypothetical protein